MTEDNTTPDISNNVVQFKRPDPGAQPAYDEVRIKPAGKPPATDKRTYRIHVTQKFKIEEKISEDYFDVEGILGVTPVFYAIADESQHIICVFPFEAVAFVELVKPDEA